MSSDASADGDRPNEGSERSSSGESSPVPTMARTTARQLESNLLGSGADENLGQTRVQTRVLNEDVADLVRLFGPDEGGILIHGLLAVQKVTRNPGGLPKCLLR